MLTHLPIIINITGWVSTGSAMLGAVFNASLKPLLLTIGFMIWIMTNAFDLCVNAYFYHNLWLTTQFSFYLCTAVFGLVMSLKKMSIAVK